MLTRKTLAEISRAQQLAPKWLIAPSLRVGHQWLDAAVRRGNSAINFRVVTLRGLAMELVAEQLVAGELMVIDAAVGSILVGELWEQIAPHYLGALERTASLERALYESLHSLRLAGLSPDKLDPRHFEIPDKGKELAQFLIRYQRELRARHLVDYPDVLTMAIETIANRATVLEADALVLIPDDLEIHGLERQFVESISKSQRMMFVLDQLDLSELNDVRVFGHLLQSNQLGPVKHDGSLALFRAVGAVNEVREVLRLCISEQQPFDQMELLHTDTQTYVPLIYELVHRLVDQRDSSGEIPVTFAEGIPASYARPGRALSVWLAWMEQDYPQQQLIRLINDGLLEFAPDEEPFDFGWASLAAKLRSVGIGFGHDRYLRKLDEYIERFQTVPHHPSSGGVDDEADIEESSAAKIDVQQARERHLTGLRLLRRRIAELLDISEPWSDPPDSKTLLDRALVFLERFARTLTRLDQLASERLMQEIQRLRDAIDLSSGLVSVNVHEWLRRLPGETMVMSSGPRPGCLHVAHVLSGGHTDRSRTFIMGLDDTRFPGSPGQDPILLDRERARLEQNLPLAEARSQQRLQAFARLMMRLRGKLTLSYSCYDLVDDRELFPSSTILAAFRTLTDKADADPTELSQIPAASFAPDSVAKALDENDWWLCQLSQDELVQNASALVEERFPHLGRGARAMASRSSANFTPYDGLVPAAGEDFDSSTTMKPLSASALETIGQCPLRYFFRYPLRVRLLDEWTVDVETWLDPLAFGSLLHEVFRIFMLELWEHSKTPNVERDQKRLFEILEQQIAKFRDDIPPPNEAAYRRQRRQLRRAAHIFLVAETEFCKNSSPQYFEASIGVPFPQRLSELDTTDPVLLTLANGLSLRACGRIDRIDKLNDEQFTIWDYKTGSSSRYLKANPFQQGRIVQNLLYLQIVQSALREKVAAEVAVTSFGYFFPGERDWGHRISWTCDELSDGSAILELLCEIIHKGTFLPTNLKKDCDFCDYRLVCHDIDMITQGADLKLANDANVGLEAMRKLRTNGPSKKST